MWQVIAAIEAALESSTEPAVFLQDSWGMHDANAGPSVTRLADCMC